ncbi:hypothetical protein, partial [Nostoc sp.]|uniref:hypothetical protein n=1 Tax=Nostoc sp. TaxID=1180 RepID=UPI002FF5F925
SQSNMLPSLNNLFFYIFQVYNLCGWFDIKLLLIDLLFNWRMIRHKIHLSIYPNDIWRSHR